MALFNRTWGSRRLMLAATTVSVTLIALAGAAAAAANDPRVTTKVVQDVVVASLANFPPTADVTVKASVAGGSGTATLHTATDGRAVGAFRLPAGYSGSITLTATSGDVSVTASDTAAPSPTPTWSPVASTAVTTAAPSTTAAPTTVPSTGVPSTTSAPSASATESGSLLFEDEFSGPAQSAPDAGKWVDYGSWCKTPEGVTVDQPGFGYISCDTKKYLDGSGNLVLPATPQQGSGVQTATKFGFVYGEASAWMKMPKEPGYWPAFWTLNGLNQKSSLVGEADITEYYSTWNGTYHAVTHSWGSTPSAAQPGGKDNFCTMGADLTDGFHKYSARFEPGKITYSLDDKVCATEVASTFTQWPFGPNNMSDNWLILDNAIGGAGGAQTPASQDSQVLVSRVEVRAL